MRADLLALGPDALAALANRGLVKRAARELETGAAPILVEAADGTLDARFADGTEVRLAAGTPLERGRCSCAASGICRHLVATVLAYRRDHDHDHDHEREPGHDRGLEGERADETDRARDGEGGGRPPERWSPGELDDEALVERLGARLLAKALRAWRAGYRARVRRPGTTDPVATVELATCTVRFLVARDLGYARVDAAGTTRDEAIALAVWACRRADEVDRMAEVLDVDVGGAAANATGAGSSGVEPALAALAELLDEGVANVGDGLAGALALARRALETRALRWPLDALDELAAQIDAYRARSARHDPETVARLIAELLARHRSVACGGRALASDVLGSDEAAETRLRLLRLVGLGARITGDARARRVEVYLAQPDAGVVLAIRRQVEVDEDVTAEALGRRKAGGHRLAALAAGNVVTESAVRAANRLLRIAANRVARTTVSPSAGDWDALGGALLVRDLDAEATRLAALAPEMVRARIVAESLRAVAVSAVRDLHYAPGAQRLDATLAGESGQARLVFTHSGAAAGAIDAIADCLGGAQGEVRFVAGHLRRAGGELMIEPTAVATATAVVVPAFAAVAMRGRAIGRTPTPDPLRAALDEAFALLAELAHRGRRRSGAGWARRCRESAGRLGGLGLTSTGDALTRAGRVAGGDASAEEALDAWADAALRVTVALEQL